MVFAPVIHDKPYAPPVYRSFCAHFADYSKPVRCAVHRAQAADPAAHRHAAPDRLPTALLDRNRARHDDADEAQEKIRQVFDATSFEVTDDFPNFIITDRVTGESVEVWLHLSGTNRTTPIDYVVIMPSSGTEWLLADVHSFLYDWQSAIHVLTLSGKVFQHIYYDQYRVMLELPAADCGQSSIFQPVYSILFRSTILDNPSAYTLEWRGFHTCQP